MSCKYNSIKEIMTIDLNYLKYIMDQFDRILFFEKGDFAAEFFQSKELNIGNQKILILTLRQVISKSKNIFFQQVSEQEMKEIIDLYYMYEFSDRFILVLGETPNYANLYDFVKLSSFNMENMLEALLH